VFGGSVNGTGALSLKVTTPYQDTMLAPIIRRVEQAQAHKGRAQRFADRFGAIYTPAMVALAVLVATIPPLLAGDWRGWVYRLGERVGHRLGDQRLAAARRATAGCPWAA
jgi:Cd2+/Zn2+-exporting ATPase